MTSSWPPPAPDSAAGGIPAPIETDWWSSTTEYAEQAPLAGPQADTGIGRDIGLAALLLVVLAMAGIVVGFGWHAFSARPHIVQRQDGTIGLPAETDKNYFGAEAAYFAVTAVAGLVSGLLTWTVGRRRGPAVAVGLALGSVAAGLIARAVGQAQDANAAVARVCGQSNSKGFDSFCSIYNGHLQLRIAGLTLTWAIMSLAMFLTLSLLADRTPRPSFPWAPPPLQPWLSP